MGEGTGIVAHANPRATRRTSTSAPDAGDRAAALGVGPCAEEPVYETERERGGFAERDRDDVCDEAADRELGRDRRDRGRARDRRGGRRRERLRDDAGQPLPARKARLDRPRETEQTGGGEGAEDEGDVEGDERIDDRHRPEREPERAPWLGAAAERAGEEHDAAHPRRADRGAAAAREIGVEPSERDPERRGDTSDVHAIGQRWQTDEEGTERRDEAHHDEHEMHARDGEQMREAALAERTGIAIGEVVFAEDERSRHRGGVGRERLRRCVCAKACARAIDDGAPAPKPRRGDHEIVGAAGETIARRAEAGTRVGIVPEAVRRGERRGRHDAIAARDRLRRRARSMR